MDLFAAELLPPFQPPSNPEVQLAVFAEEGVHEQLGETGEYLSRCAHYAIRHKLYLVTGLFCYDGALCLCLLGPDGMPVLRQGPSACRPGGRGCARPTGWRWPPPGWAASASAPGRISSTPRWPGRRR